MKQNAIVPIERIERKIYFIRGQKVILDFDLARLYEVETKVLLQAVKRNIGRFPDDFMFQLTESEFRGLRSQFVTSKGRGGRRFLAYAFTEHGVAMLSSVLHSERAVQVNIAIIFRRDGFATGICSHPRIPFHPQRPCPEAGRP